jgi:hypothetical protein
VPVLYMHSVTVTNSRFPGCCDSPGARITMEVKPTGMNTVFDENTKLKREEGKEAVKGVAYSRIYLGRG